MVDRRRATARNIRFAKDWFLTNVYRSKLKAESHRFSYETSEDALTWNVCAALFEVKGGLRGLAKFLTDAEVPSADPQLYLWGMRVELNERQGAQLFAPLEASRGVFEPDIRRYLTEPDLMLYFPEELLILCEVKFTSPNGVAQRGTADVGDKPRDMEGTLRRYGPNAIPGVIDRNGISQPFYTQLYRNLVFAAHMGNAAGARWHVANLVSKTQWQPRTGTGFNDPSDKFTRLLSDPFKNRFTFRTWEDYWHTRIEGNNELQSLDEYFRYKTAGLNLAFDDTDTDAG